MTPALADPVAAARRAAPPRAGRASPMRCGTREKWRLALEMIEEMTGPGGWGVLEQVTAAGGARPVVAADAGYGDNTTFRLELDRRAAGSTRSRSRAPPAPTPATPSAGDAGPTAAAAARPSPPTRARR